jgi:hypothetical protein
MKKYFLLAIALFVTCFAFAGNADLFKVDEQALNNEFSDLSALENYVVANNFVSLNEIETGNLYDLSGLNVNSMGATSSGNFTFQWEGFLWGFLCCPVGFFVIAINESRDHDQKMSYWIGVAAGVVLSAITSPYYYHYF